MAYDEGMARFSPGLQAMTEVTAALLADETIEFVDSCAVPDHPLMDHLWRDRLAMADVMIGLSPGANFARACRLEIDAPRCHRDGAQREGRAAPPHGVSFVSCAYSALQVVMAGLDPATPIQSGTAVPIIGVAGTSPAMTVVVHFTLRTRLPHQVSCPSASGMSRSVLGANSSSSLTRRSVRPCSWAYCSSASMLSRFCPMP